MLRFGNLGQAGQLSAGNSTVVIPDFTNMDFTKLQSEAFGVLLISLIVIPTLHIGFRTLFISCHMNTTGITEDQYTSASHHAVQVVIGIYTTCFGIPALARLLFCTQSEFFQGMIVEGSTPADATSLVNLGVFLVVAWACELSARSSSIRVVTFLHHILAIASGWVMLHWGNFLVFASTAVILTGAGVEFPLFLALLLYRFKKQSSPGMARWFVVFGVGSYFITRLIQVALLLAIFLVLPGYPTHSVVYAVAFATCMNLIQGYTFIIYKQILTRLGLAAKDADSMKLPQPNDASVKADSDAAAICSHHCTELQNEFTGHIHAEELPNPLSPVSRGLHRSCKIHLNPEPFKLAASDIVHITPGLSVTQSLENGNPKSPVSSQLDTI